MKNIRQLLELNHIEDRKIRSLFEQQYENDLTSSDNYFRYYPNDNSYIDEDTKQKINDWLLSDGYEITDDPYFHILIRWDW